MARAEILAKAVAEWNRGEHYEAHEILEDFADTVEDDDRDHKIALALIRVAACFHKWAHDVGKAAVSTKLKDARQDLAGAPSPWHGLDLTKLNSELNALQTVIDRGDQPDRWPTL